MSSFIADVPNKGEGRVCPQNRVLPKISLIVLNEIPQPPYPRFSNTVHELQFSFEQI